MSEATRCFALQQAVTAYSREPSFPGFTLILSTAEAFAGFLEGAPTAIMTFAPETAPAPAAKPAKPAKAAKPARATPEADTPEGQGVAALKAQQAAEIAAREAADDAADAAPTEEQVGGAITALIAANKRAETVALLAEYGAKSKSTLPKDKWPEFLAKAEGLLLAA
jgi:hypothetical protein